MPDWFFDSTLETTPFHILRTESRRKYTSFFYQFAAFLMQCGPYEGSYKPVVDQVHSDAKESDAPHILRQLKWARALDKALQEGDQSKIHRCLHLLLWEVLTQVIDTDTEVGHFDYLPTQFLIGHALEASGKIQEAHHISPQMAKMQWVSRLVHFRHAIMHREKHGTSIE